MTYRRARFLCDDPARALLRRAIDACRAVAPFEVDGFVLLPDHLHALWTLPQGDADFSTRWARIKRSFTRAWVAGGGWEGSVSDSRRRNRRRGVWQRRFWEHVIRDETDLARHLNYIHYNQSNTGWPNARTHGRGRRFTGLSGQARTMQGGVAGATGRPCRFRISTDWTPMISNWRLANDVIGPARNGPQEYLRTLQVWTPMISNWRLPNDVIGRAKMVRRSTCGPFRSGELLMKPKQTWKTARELLNEMAADPVRSQRLKEKSARREKRAQASRAALDPVVQSVNSLGFPGETINDIVKINAPLPPPVVAVLLSSIDRLKPREQEAVVRALGAARDSFDASILVDLFDSTQDYALKWAIVNTFAIKKPRGSQQWLARIRGTAWETTFNDLA